MLSQTGGQFSFTLDQAEKRGYGSGAAAPCTKAQSDRTELEGRGPPFPSERVEKKFTVE